MRVLSLRELNRATLARQLLLERRRASPLRAIERLAGMQAQYSPAPYVGLWSRVEPFRRETLERAVQRGDAFKATLMRGTLHLVTARDYPVFFAALQAFRWWSSPDATPIGEAAAASIRELYRVPQPAGVGLAFIAERHPAADELTHRRAWYVARVAAHILHSPDNLLWSAGPRASFVAYPEPPALDQMQARAELVRRYLGAFGPASRADVSAWSGVPVRELTPAIDSLEPLRRFADERGRELLDLPRAPLPAGDVRAPVRLLPKWDNVLLSFADRTRVLPEELRKQVIGKNGDVAQTVLVDGVVAALWRADRGRVVVEPLTRMSRTQRAEVDDEARRLEEWLR